MDTSTTEAVAEYLDTVDFLEHFSADEGDEIDLVAYSLDGVLQVIDFWFDFAIQAQTGGDL